jgi:hypothetical protein
MHRNLRGTCTAVVAVSVGALLTIGASAEPNEKTRTLPSDVLDIYKEVLSENGFVGGGAIAGGPPVCSGDPTTLLYPLDGTYVLVDFFGDGPTGAGPAQGPDQHNDDDSATVPLPFTFDLYGDLYTLCFVNNNGNITFGTYFSSFVPVGFPDASIPPMIAPFWGDVDTGNPNNFIGDVWMKFIDSGPPVGNDTLVVTWDNVGYYNEHGDLRNTFQVAISDGTNPVMGLGLNVCFSYDNMCWTTGDASGGSGGFGGTPATVGANRGNGVDFFQIGRFDHPGVDYDGPFGNPDGVSWLDGLHTCFNTSTTTTNIDPIAVGFPPGNMVKLDAGAGDVLDLDLQFLSPEAGQTTTVTIDDPDGAQPAGLMIVNTPGNTATVNLDWAPDCGDAGTYVLNFTATDDFNPPGVTQTSLVIEVNCEIEYSLDIKPGSCPNSFNRSSHGVLPVALAGSPAFDVTNIDIGTILLSRADGVGGSVAPHEGPPGPHTEVEDVTSTFEVIDCECEETTPDGIFDLSMKFKTDDVVSILELDSLPAGAWVELVVSGQLLDGTTFSANDCVRLVPPGTPPGAVMVSANLPGIWVDATPLDDQLDGGGFTFFARTYPWSTVVTVSAPLYPADHPGWVLDRWYVNWVPMPAGVTELTFPVGDMYVRFMQVVYRELAPPDIGRSEQASRLGSPDQTE